MSDSKMSSRLSTPPADSVDLNEAASQQLHEETVSLLQKVSQGLADTPPATPSTPLLTRKKGDKAELSGNEEVAAPQTPKKAAVKKEPKEPKTPKAPKVPKTPKTPKSNKRAAPADGDDAGEATTAKKVKKEAGTPGRNAKKIPTSMVELTAEDRMLVTLRDKGESWAKVTDMWTTITGAPPGGKSTLPNRYARLKANLTNFPEEHMDLLLAAYKKVIDQIEVEKWGRVKSAMEEDDTVKSQNYTIVALQKHHKKAVEAAAARAASGSSDGDAGTSAAGTPATDSQYADQAARADSATADGIKEEE